MGALAVVAGNALARVQALPSNGEGEMIASTTASSKRSVVKAITYRVIIICLDFLVIYLLTGRLRMAFAL